VPRSGGSSLLDLVFPVGRGVRSWTTIQGVDGAVPLSDETFRPIKNMNKLLHTIVMSPGPNPKQALEASYSKGSWALNNNGAPGGFSFYASGPPDVDLTTAKEATFGYSVMFEQGMEWSLGGKLPGFCESFFSHLSSSIMSDEGAKMADLMIWLRLSALAAAATLPAGLRD
jgi:hypothetical protein